MQRTAVNSSTSKLQRPMKGQRRGEPLPQRGVIDQPGQRFGEAFDVARLHQQTRFAVGDNIFDGADRGRDDREAGRHAFDHRERQVFREGGQDENVSRRDQFGDARRRRPSRGDRPGRRCRSRQRLCARAASTSPSPAMVASQFERSGHAAASAFAKSCGTP